MRAELEPAALSDLARASAAGRWLSETPDPDACREPTDLVESEHPVIRALAARLPRGSAWETAAAAFEAVRDGIRYDFAPDLHDREDWRAAATVERGYGFCQQKAVVLASVLRAAAVPAALAFEDLYDAKIKPPFSDLLGGQLLPWHGLVLAHLDGRWVRADACLDAELCRSRGYRVAEFAPPCGGPLPLTDSAGRPHFRTVEERTTGVDLPDAAVRGVLDLEVIHRPEWKEQVRLRRGSM